MSYTCLQCEKTFNSAEALEQHNKAKHNIASGESTGNKSNKGKLIFWVVLILIAIGIIYWGFTAFVGAGKYDSFAQCISESGAKFYGAFWCSHCKAQKDMFGSSAKYLPYIECSSGQGNPQFSVCNAAGIQSYPTWIFVDGTQGNVMTLEELSQKTNCQLPE